MSEIRRKGLDLAAGFNLLKEREVEREKESLLRQAWAEGMKAGGLEEAKKRMSAMYQRLNREPAKT